MTKRIKYLADSEMSRISDNNAESFYNMRKEIVNRLQHLASIDDIAKELKVPIEEVAEFEQYYADPTLSEVQEYALLVNSFVDIQVRDHKDEGSSLDRHSACERIVNEKIADGDFDGIMKVVDENDSFPVVTMLSDDPLSMLEEQVNAIGGRANVFISDEDGEISYMAVDGFGQGKEGAGE